MTTTTSAVAVLTKELARPDPTPDALLEALRTAGFEVKAVTRPAWMPTTPDAYALVKQAADWHNSGLRDRYEIAEQMGRNKRSIDRYLAAAGEMGLLLHADQEEGPPR
ncbi:hypothetical protein [Nonomuraea sp. SYSU D8015]|uniref:hypothetical protein n=1 Tax=Nonomuraea sp. SYSU D8015 TaxID=2593644 RepID=UPI001660BBAB|nr:hypothetical protein [Nonomuraea sp. SYSU D8015]